MPSTMYIAQLLQLVAWISSNHVLKTGTVMNFIIVSGVKHDPGLYTVVEYQLLTINFDYTCTHQIS